jgi:hypothetical protein
VSDAQDETLNVLQATLTKLALVQAQANTLRAQYEATTARANADYAETQAAVVRFGYERATRPSMLYGPLITYYDDVGSRWAVAYGVVGRQIIEILPDHITETGVTAYGATPEDALLNFDRIWIGEDNAAQSDI